MLRPGTAHLRRSVRRREARSPLTRVLRSRDRVRERPARSVAPRGGGSRRTALAESVGSRRPQTPRMPTRITRRALGGRRHRQARGGNGPVRFPSHRSAHRLEDVRRRRGARGHARRRQAPTGAATVASYASWPISSRPATRHARAGTHAPARTREFMPALRAGRVPRRSGVLVLWVGRRAVARARRRFVVPAVDIRASHIV